MSYHMITLDSNNNIKEPYDIEQKGYDINKIFNLNGLKNNMKKYPCKKCILLYSCKEYCVKL